MRSLAHWNAITQANNCFDSNSRQYGAAGFAHFLDHLLGLSTIDLVSSSSGMCGVS